MSYGGNPGTSSDDKKHDRKRVWLALTGLVVLLGGLYVAGYFFTGDRIPTGTEVAGVSIGGMSSDSAEAKLSEEIDSQARQEIELYIGEQDFSIDPVEAGLTFDLDETLAKVGGKRSWSPIRMIETLVSSERIDPVIDVDEIKLSDAMTEIAKKVNDEPVEPAITFPNAEPHVREPQTGMVLDQAAAVELVRDNFLDSDGPLELPVAEQLPAVDRQDVDRAMSEIVDPALQGAVTLKVGDKLASIPSWGIARSISVEVRDDELVAVIEKKAFDEVLDNATKDIVRKPKNATVELPGGKGQGGGEPQIKPGKPGLAVKRGDAADLFLEAIAETNASKRVFRLDTVKVPPKVTKKDVDKLGVSEKVSSYTTEYPAAEYRDINQGRAAELIDGTLLEPGDVFSFNDIVGERTVENGFTIGTIIDGGVFREELGGGVSQVATTTFNAAFFAGLEDIEHKPHSFYIDRYPMGREATVAWGSVDLQFRNDTDYGVLIDAWVEPSLSSPDGIGRMNVEMWSTKVWDIEAGLGPQHNWRDAETIYDESDECVEQSPVSGFDVDVYRDFYQDGEKVRRETMPATYAAAAAVYCGPAPT